MKKLITLMLPLVMLIILCSCGKKETAPTVKVEDLFSSGYEIGLATLDDENNFQAIIQNGETASYMTFETKLSDEQADAYNNYDVFNDDYQTYFQDFCKGCSDYTINDISDAVPSQEELDAYVGKTVGDVKAAGFEEWARSWGEEQSFFTFDNGTYEADFFLVSNNGITDPDSASEDEINALEIKEVYFNGISDNYFN